MTELSQEAYNKIVAERDQVRAELKSTRKMLQMLMDNLPQQIYWKNADLEFLGCNILFSEEFDVENPDDLIGCREESYSYETGDRISRLFLSREYEIMNRGIPQYEVVENFELNDREVWVSSSHVPLFQNGKIIGVLGSYQDISDRIRDEQELEKHRDHLSELVKSRTAALETANTDLAKSNQDLEEANLAKTRFVANISHEIRTPLNAVVAMTEFMLDTQVTSVQQEYLSTIQESTDSLLYAINDLLDFSKIEAGKLQLEKIHFNLRETVESSLKSLAVKAYQKNLEMLIDIDPGVPKMMKGDPLRIRQIIVNLVGNSLKFTSSGEILLRINLKQTLKDKIELQFSVSDTGIGIPKERQSSIFNPFEQVDNSTTRNFGGTGLGLSIVYQLVQLMEGDISIESQEGKGTTFHYNLKLDAISELNEPAPACEIGRFKGKSAVILDDNSGYIEITSSILERWGFSVTAIEQLNEFDGWIQSSSEITAPDLLIVDSRIGLETKLMGSMRAAKTRLGNKTHLLFSLTGGEILKKIEGDSVLFDSGFIFKPMVDASLCEKLKGLFNADGNKSIRNQNNTLTESSGKSLHVLFVDDRKLNQKIGRSLLLKFGHTADFANNGVEAVQMIERKQYDLVLMDIQMPLMDGYEATKVIREREKTKGTRLPIIAVTANALKGEVERTFKAGMDSYIPKPIRSAQMLSTIEAVMKQYSNTESSI